MNKKLTARIISIILVLTLALLPLSAAVAAEPVTETQIQTNTKAPYILIRGFMSSDIHADKNDLSSDTVWPPSTKNIVPTVFKVITPLISLILFRDYDKFCTNAFPYINELFASACLDKNGDPVGTSGVVREFPTEEQIKNGEDLQFKYDWRLNPTDVASDLEEYIDYVTEVSGSEKVCIECRSFGGVIALTYAGIYGCDKIQSLVLNASAVYGAGFAGELFQGKMKFDSDGLTEFLKAAFAFNKNEKLLNGLFAVLKITGITGKICDLLNGLVENSGERLLKECLFPVFGCWPSTWAMVSEDAFDASYDFVFNTVFKNDKTDFTALQSKINTFEDSVRSKKTDIINRVNGETNLYVISKHGFTSMFMTDAWTNPGDMVLECADSSFGATVAPYGEKLSDSYLAGKDAAYISPDKAIDASTCLLPEQTWFIGNVTHSKVFDSTLDFTKALLYYDGQATVADMTGYSRFMTYDEEADALVPAK